MLLINTRPQDAATKLTQGLRAAGVCVYELPLLDIEPLKLDEAAQQRLKNIADRKLVVCVSPRAARFTLAYAQKAGVDVSSQKNWVSVGQTTAQVLAQAGIASSVPHEQSNEGMLAMRQMQTLNANDSVLMLRGVGGRRLLDDALKAKDVQVDELALYARKKPKALVKDYKALRAWCEAQATATAPFVLVSSKQALDNWLGVCHEPAAYRYVALGTRLHRLIGKLGLLTHQIDRLSAQGILLNSDKWQLKS